MDSKCPDETLRMRTMSLHTAQAKALFRFGGGGGGGGGGVGGMGGGRDAPIFNTTVFIPYS